MKQSPIVLIPLWLLGVSLAFWLFSHAILELRIAMNAWNL